MQQRIAGLRHHETQAPAIGGIDELVEQSHLLQLVGHRGDESAAEMQMRCEFAHADIAFLAARYLTEISTVYSIPARPIAAACPSRTVS